MKNWIKIIAALLCVGMWSCQDPEGIDDNSPLKVTVKSTTASSVEFDVTTRGFSRVAYVIYKVADDGSVEQAPSIPMMFVKGTTAEVTDGSNTIVIDKLQGNSDYVAYFTAEVAATEDFWDRVVTVDGIRTGDFSQDVRIYDIGYSGFKVDLRVAPEVKEQNHVIKMGTMDLYTYHSEVLGGVGSGSDIEAMDYRSDYYPDYCFQNSVTLDIHENGVMYGAMLPGQPQVIFFGEYKYGKMGYEPVEHYSIPLFDWVQFMADRGNPYDQAPYWSGFYYNEHFRLKEPAPLNVELAVDVEIESNDATITIPYEEGIYAYAVAMLNQEAYGNLLPMLKGNEDYLMWWTTSSPAIQSGWTTMFFADTHVKNGKLTMHLSDWMQDWVLSAGAKFHMLVTAIGGEETAEGFVTGTKQAFKYVPITLIDYSKPAPTVEVTADACTPDTVSWKIKCTSGDAQTVKFVCNYERSWQSYGGATADIIKSLLDGSSITMPVAYVDEINADGYVLKYSSKPNTESLLAVLVVNDEGRRTYTEAVSAFSLPEAKDEPVSIPDLDGDWTMSATVATVDEVTKERKEHQMSCKIHIGLDGMTAPETLPQSVYDVFADANWSVEETDAFYEEFTEALEIYNEYTVTGQNRVQLNGWGLEASGGYDCRYATPYELFISSEYSAYNAVAPIYDFGPKWYIEFDAEGNAWVPYNIEYYGPMSAWTTTLLGEYKVINEYFLMPSNEKYNLVLPYGGVDQTTYIPYDGKIPVEISEDKNTITIKGAKFTQNGEVLTFYPNMVNYNTVEKKATIYTHIASDIVLTRGYTEPTEAAATVKAAKQVVDMSNYNINVPKRKEARTYMPKRKEMPKFNNKLKWMGQTNLEQE